MPLPAAGDGYVAERYKSPFVVNGSANFSAGSTIATVVAPFDMRVYNIALYLATSYSGTVQVRVNGTVVASVTVPSGSGGRVFEFTTSGGAPVIAEEGSLIEVVAASGGSGTANATVTFIPAYVPPSVS